MVTEYHLQYAKKSDADILHRAWIKEVQLRQIFATVGLPQVAKPVVNVAVLGSADARLVAQHDRIFSAIFQKPVALTTFDITVEHLQSASGVMQHDVTLPLPGGPYDVVYGDVLLRFIPPEKQLDVLVNAWNALAPGGVAIHVFAMEDFHPEMQKEKTPGIQPIDFNTIQLKLNEQHIFYAEVPLRIETTKPGTEDKMVIDEIAMVFRKS